MTLHCTLKKSPLKFHTIFNNLRLFNWNLYAVSKNVFQFYIHVLELFPHLEKKYMWIACIIFSIAILQYSLWTWMVGSWLPSCYQGLSWSWSYGSWNYNYISNQCLSPQALIARTYHYPLVSSPGQRPPELLPSLGVCRRTA
jgi:hypothetical protein